MKCFLCLGYKVDFWGLVVFLVVSFGWFLFLFWSLETAFIAYLGLRCFFLHCKETEVSANIMHYDSTNLNTQVLEERAVRCITCPTQLCQDPIGSCEATRHDDFVSKFTLLCSQAYSTVSSHFSATLNILLHRLFWLPLPLNKSILVHTPTVFMLPSPACGDKQQRKPSQLPPVFMDLLLLEGFIDKSFLANSFQSQNSTRRVGNWVGWRSCELNHHRRLSIHKGEFFFSLTEELR